MDDELYGEDPDRWLSLARKLGWMVVGLFLFYGAFYLLKSTPWLAPHALRLADVRFAPEPPCGQERFLQDVKRIGSLPDVLPAELGPRFPPLIAAAASHPWVEDVEAIRHLRSDLAEVTVRWRVPVLELERHGKPCYVSRDGVLLPFIDGLRERPLKLQGLEIPPDARPGDRLAAPELKRLLAAASALRHEWSHWKLTHLEMHADPIQPTLRLHSAGGTVIVWLSLGKNDQDVSDDEKTHRLRRYLLEFGSFEKPNGPYLLDVRPKGELHRQHLK